MGKLEYNNLGQLFIASLVSMFWAFISTLGLLWEVLKLGPSKYFYIQERGRRPECLEDGHYGQHGFIRCKNQNVTIHYVADGDENKPLMLFLHGFPEFWYSWRNQMKEFRRDYRVVAIDMRGYGETSKPIGIAEYHMKKLTFDVKEVIEGLGYDSCILVAHDWGGAVAWNFTFEYPSMVDNLIVCNIPHPRAMMKHLQSSRSQMLKSWYIFFFQIPFLPEIILKSKDLGFLKAAFTGKRMGAKSGAFTDEDVEAFKYVFTPAGALTGPINYYRAALRYKPPTYSSWKISNIPVLMIWGTNDGALEKQMATMSGDYVEDYTLHFIEGASHWVQNDEPNLVNNYMRDFLDQKFRKSKM